jgi:hypothetical protein
MPDRIPRDPVWTQSGTGSVASPSGMHTPFNRSHKQRAAVASDMHPAHSDPIPKPLQSCSPRSRALPAQDILLLVPFRDGPGTRRSDAGAYTMPSCLDAVRYRAFYNPSWGACSLYPHTCMTLHQHFRNASGLIRPDAGAYTISPGARNKYTTSDVVRRRPIHEAILHGYGDTVL